MFKAIDQILPIPNCLRWSDRGDVCNFQATERWRIGQSLAYYDLALDTYTGNRPSGFSWTEYSAAHSRFGSLLISSRHQPLVQMLACITYTPAKSTLLSVCFRLLLSPYLSSSHRSAVQISVGMYVLPDFNDSRVSTDSFLQTSCQFYLRSSSKLTDPL